jgi:hypothetical protein
LTFLEVFAAAGPDFWPIKGTLVDRVEPFGSRYLSFEEDELHGSSPAASVLQS